MAYGDEAGVLITGVFGTGKSTVAEEIADILEQLNAPFAVLDLDWLGWFNAADQASFHRVLLKNLSAVTGNYRAAGVRIFVLAYAIPDASHLADLKAALAMPVRVVRLTLPLDEIAARLGPAVTAGRRDDLRQAAAWLAESRGEGIEDLTVPNNRPIREVATGILEWLGWR